MALPRKSPFASLDRTLRGILWTALAIGIVVLSLGVRQVDLWWQLPDGLAILKTHRLPAGPTTAFGFPAEPYVDEYSLYEIVLAALDKIGGLGAIRVAFTAVFLLIFALPFSRSIREPRDLISAALVALAAIFMINRYEQRPEVVGVLLLVVFIRLLERTRELKRGFLLRIALMMAVWTGVHSSWLIGLFALGLWLIQQTFRRDPARRWSPVAAASTFATACGAVLINPYGLGRIAFTLKQQVDAGSNLLSPEMWPAWEQPAGVFPLMLVAAAVLGLALFSRQRPPAWLGGLALALFSLTLFNIRHMSFLAGALLVVAAHRRFEPEVKWQVLRTPFLAAACIAVLLFDFVAVLRASFELRATQKDEVAGFAPALVDTISPDEKGSILCHDAAGSYLTFARPSLRPYMDSGQGRFDDATKRIYFFNVYDADAFNRTLDRLPHLTAVLVTAPVDVWTLSMMGRPGWYLAACDDHGLLFRRVTDSVSVAITPNVSTVAGCRDRAKDRGDFLHAFYFSALIDPPERSLRLLDRSSAEAWTERSYSFIRFWLRRVNPADAQAFLARHHPQNPLLSELFLDLRTDDSPLPPPGFLELEGLARMLTLKDRHRLAEASDLLRSLKKPPASALYYTLRGELDPGSDSRGTAAERWQNWEDGGDILFDRTLPRLDFQAAALARSRARQ